MPLKLMTVTTWLLPQFPIRLCRQIAAIVRNVIAGGVGIAPMWRLHPLLVCDELQVEVKPGFHMIAMIAVIAEKCAQRS